MRHRICVKSRYLLFSFFYSFLLINLLNGNDNKKFVTFMHIILFGMHSIDYKKKNKNCERETEKKKKRVNINENYLARCKNKNPNDGAMMIISFLVFRIIKEKKKIIP